MECVQIDLNNVCRTCKCESPEMKSLYYRDSDSGKENPRLDEMLMACASVQVNKEDGLPKSICRTCFVQLKNAYSFKEQCEKADLFLRDYIKNGKKDNVKKEYIKEETSINGLEYTSEPDQMETDENSKDQTESVIKADPEPSDYVQVIDNNLVGLIECRTCFKEFFSLEALTSHERTHTRRGYKCKQCGKSYARKTNLRRHQLIHGKRKMHICKICNKTLTRFEYLKRHLLTHLKDKPFSCQSCNRGFNRGDHLLNHVKCCKGEKVFVCDICNRGFNRADSLEVHKHIHENKMPLLPTLENLDNIEQHYMEVDFDEHENAAGDNDNAVDNFSDEEYDDMDNTDTGGNDNVIMSEETIEPEVEVSENDDLERLNDIANITNTIYVEDDPPEMLMEKAEIIEDEQAVEADENTADNGNDYESDNSTHSEYLPAKQTTQKIKRGRGRPRKHPVTFKKTLDGSRRRGRPSLKSKIKTDDESGNYSCPECKETFTKLSLLERHAETHKGLRIHECGTCGKTFNRLNSLKRHKLSHSDVKSFLCITCRKWFSRRDHLQKHMKLHFNNSDGTSAAHSCGLCHAVFSREENLLKHKAYKHNIGEKIDIPAKKFKCEYCQKLFTTEKYRDAHMKAHFSDRKYQCKTCEKTFISKSHLNEHVKFHNDSSKKFLCSECGQRFIRNDYLTIHMRRHRGEKPFKCKFCGKGFPRTTDLTVHERYHTGEKTHLCTVCGRGFGRAYNLTVHMRTHTGEKPYRCTYCDAAFAQGNDLKAHVRRHTGERYQCELCPETFLMGYLLTQHKRVVHGLNVVSNIRRLQPVATLNPDDPPPVTIPLPPPVFIPSGTATITEITALSDPLQLQQNEFSELIKEELK